MNEWDIAQTIPIPGNPKALKRHRTVSLGKTGRLRNYDPSARDKADFLAKVIEMAPKEPYSGPLCVDIDLWIQRPRNHYRTGKYAGELKKSVPAYVSKRPDIDNYIKFVFDALNGIYWKDDSIIVSVKASKRYGKTPGVVIIIKTTENE